MDVCRECCVLSGRGLCDELFTRPEESYWLWCVVVCDLKTSWIRRPWPTGGCRVTNKQAPFTESTSYGASQTPFRLGNCYTIALSLIIWHSCCPFGPVIFLMLCLVCHFWSHFFCRLRINRYILISLNPEKEVEWSHGLLQLWGSGTSTPAVSRSWPQGTSVGSIQTLAV